MDDQIQKNTSSVNIWAIIWLYFFIAFTCLISVISIFSTQSKSEEAYYDDENVYEDDYQCNVSWILVRWYIDTYGESLDSSDSEDSDDEDFTSADTLLDAIESAKYDDDVQALIIEIDSYGGNPVAAEEVTAALKTVWKPVYAHIRGAAASAAYWIATGADTIYASKNSNVWSIGATMSYLDYTAYNEKEGFSYNEISSWKFKNSGSVDKALSQEEKVLFQRDIDIIAQNFIEAVSENRNLPISEVQKIADGSTVLWARALELKLIDKIWVMNKIYDDIEKELDEEISICWY